MLRQGPRGIYPAAVSADTSVQKESPCDSTRASTHILVEGVHSVLGEETLAAFPSPSLQGDLQDRAGNTLLLCVLGKPTLFTGAFWAQARATPASHTTFV
jgi:hypothetical protein